jgi:hypothetical protein
MIKYLLFISTAFYLLPGCSSLKPLTHNPNQQSSTANTTSGKKDVKFLDEISVTPDKRPIQHSSSSKNSVSSIEIVKKVEDPPNYFAFSSAEIENATPIQIKYAILMDIEVESVRNVKMFEYIDKWYGTKYRMGGTTTKGIDCSAFVQAVFSSVYGIDLPRTAREQYQNSSRISRTQLREGDLLFYNTRGGISHVGIYLQNNKFVHAASSEGVMISDIFDPYWMKRFMGVGRVERQAVANKQ